MIQRMANRELTSYVRGGDRRVDKWGWDHSKVFYCFIKNHGMALVLCCYFFCLFCPYHANFLITLGTRGLNYTTRGTHSRVSRGTGWPFSYPVFQATSCMQSSSYLLHFSFFLEKVLLLDYYWRRLISLFFKFIAPKNFNGTSLAWP